MVINSIEATSRGGKITIKTKYLKEKDQIRIMVTDDGKGISDEVLPHIFEPFFSTKVKSTGLGLSVVYGIVEQHSGNIDVASKVDQGTTFTIAFPLGSHKKENHDRRVLSNFIQQNTHDGSQS